MGALDLAKLTVAARPRTSWEGIDLGFVMAREWFLPLWGLWWLGALPLNLLLVLLLGGESWLALLLSWWLKPLYEPPLLFWLSRALFGERLPLRKVLRQWPVIVRPRLLANLTWARLNPSRSFHMPVALLERLGSTTRRDRIRVLGRGQQAGFWLTYMGIHFELALELSCIVLLLALLPEELQWLDWRSLLLHPGSLEQWLQYAADLLAMSLIAPFYVAGGFGLYLVRRIELEAWDIEIVFRRMQERHQNRSHSPSKGATAVLLALGLAVSGSVQEVQAQQISASEAQRAVQEVLADDAFGKREMETYWEYVGGSRDDSVFSIDLLVDFFEGFFQGIARVGELLLWVGGALLLVFFAYRIARNRQWLQPEWALPGRKASAPPAELFGLDLRPESLPADLVKETLALLRQGQQRAALSLLYRGSLVRLVHAPGMEIPAGATEGECLRLVRAGRPEREADFFRRLTHSWLHMAYGHRPLAAGGIEALCRDWRTLYGTDHAE